MIKRKESKKTTRKLPHPGKRESGMESAFRRKKCSIKCTRGATNQNIRKLWTSQPES